MIRFTLDLDIYRGDTFSQPIRIRSTDASGQPGDPLDLSGWQWAAQARKDADSTEPMAVFDIDSSQAAEGILVLRISAEQTSGMSAGLWDLQGTAVSGDTTTVLTRGGGAVRVKKDITR